jgi:very-short-patch-repair endonuclease
MTVVSDIPYIACDFLHDRTVNFAVQQNHVPLVKRLRITNTGTIDLEQLSVVITSEPEFASKWETVITILPAGKTVDIGVVDLLLSPSFLATLTERLVGLLRLSVFHNGIQIYSAQSNIDVFAYDEWNGIQTLPEIIAAFVTPNHPEITRVLRQASDILKEWTGNPSLDGYQSKNPLRVRVQLAAIYTALQSMEIAYCVPPASFEEQGQKIRTPESIRENKLATCLDLAVLFASCAEAAGLNPLIIFTKGHAFTGAWLIEESFSESLQDDVTLLTKRVSAGIQEICLVETTALTAGEKANFDIAAATGEKKLQNPDEFHFFIDIRRARVSHIRPLPLRVNGQLVENIDETTITATNAPENIDAPMPNPLINTVPTEQTRQDLWERRLLDLSLRNPLLNFRITGASIPLLTAELHDLEDALANGQDFQIHPRPPDWEATPRDAAVYQQRTNDDPRIQLLREEFCQRRLHADIADKDLGNRLTQLYRAARNSLEENGANTLYLSLGMLVWYETDASEKPRYSPILMIPMEIVRKSVITGFLVRQGEDEPQLNITLLEMLRQDFNIDITGLNSLPIDENGVNVKMILTAIRRAVMHKSRWDVLEDAYLGLFSFSKFVMWHDLKARGEELKQNKVVASLMAGSLQWIPEEEKIEAENLDDDYRPGDIMCPISADSSQLTAICAAGEGKSVVLHGPPGTGKSQTITNIISHALAMGKSVLFVAEKMAALTVVQRRLSQICLAPFCLEVHSNKSRKKDVLEQLRIALEIGRTGNPQNWQQEVDRLAVLRDELNGYVESLHCERGIGHSVFHGLAHLTSVRNSPATVKFTSAQVADITPDRLLKWGDLVRQLRIAGEGCGQLNGHVWTEAKRQDYQPQLRTQAAETLTALRNAVVKLQETLTPIAEFFQLPTQEDSYRNVSIIIELAKLFQNMPAIPGTMIRNNDWDDIAISIEKLITHGRNRDSLRAELYSRYTTEVKQLYTADLLARLRHCEDEWFLPRLIGRNFVKKSLNTALKPGFKPDIDNMEKDLLLIQKLQEEEQILSAAGDRALEMLGRIWQDGNPDWDAVANAGKWAAEIRHRASEIAGTELSRAGIMREKWAATISDYRNEIISDSTISKQLRAFTDAGNAFNTAKESLILLLNLDISALTESDDAAGWFKFILSRIDAWSVSLDSLRDWCTWMRQRTLAADAGLLPVIEPYEQGLLSHGDIETAFIRGLYQAWAENEIANDPALSSFSRGLFEDKIVQFRELDETFANLTRQEIFARLAARIPHVSGDPAQNSEMGILGRELQKQRNHLALRTLFQKIPHLLSRLKPCLLMSPMSVAQYLDPSHPPFDLVIFDEASQVPTCDAVGAIARGKEAFIVGDPKQLPPTSFFNSINNDEDEESLAMQDLESILDDCLAIRMPEKRLRWHYRSQHESLIAFSNSQYYDNKLYTFPSPDDLTAKVRLIPVEGTYDRGKTKQNRAEADAVVKEIVRRLRDTELSKYSIGVVTFSQIQQKLIEDMLDEQMRLSPDLEPFFSPDAIEPVFVKNLENVQGDERDVILFSIGYGPDSTGRVSMNFGPLNNEGGWRRLNVAVSRARREMMVFSTLRSDHLDTTRTSSKGVADLKVFLEYAERGKSVLNIQQSINAGVARDVVFEEEVCKILRERGHNVHTMVGCSGYRIDMAVVDPDHPGQYLLGIECDGETYHHARTARDRDKLRESVLRQLGWKIHRIWSTDWWENPQAEINRIEQAIKNCKKNTDPDLQSEEITPVSAMLNCVEYTTESQNTPVYNAKEYEICQLNPVDLPSDSFYMPISSRKITNQLTQITTEEGPISYSLLCRRLMQAWGISKMTANVHTRLRDVLTRMIFPTTKYGDLTYYWPESSDPEIYSTFRIPGDDKETRREIIDIAPEEIANAINEILNQQISMPESELISETSRIFGYTRVGTTAEEHLRKGLNLLVDHGNANRTEDGKIVYVG